MRDSKLSMFLWVISTFLSFPSKTEILSSIIKSLYCIFVSSFLGCVYLWAEEESCVLLFLESTIGKTRTPISPEIEEIVLDFEKFLHYTECDERRSKAVFHSIVAQMRPKS